MIDKILKDIKGLFKVQDKAKFVKQNIPYLAFFYAGNIFSNPYAKDVDFLDTVSVYEKVGTVLNMGNDSK